MHHDCTLPLQVKLIELSLRRDNDYALQTAALSYDFL